MTRKRPADLAAQFRAFRINGSSELEQEPSAHVERPLRGIHAIAAVLSAGFDRHADQGKSEVDSLNRQIKSGAMDVIGHLAAEASFRLARHDDELGDVRRAGAGA